jgi:hypothetical protein
MRTFLVNAVGVIPAPYICFTKGIGWYWSHTVDPHSDKFVTILEVDHDTVITRVLKEPYPKGPGSWGKYTGNKFPSINEVKIIEATRTA